MGNEDEVVSVLKKGNLLDLQVVDTAKMSYSEQLKVKSLFLFWFLIVPVANLYLGLSFINFCLYLAITYQVSIVYLFIYLLSVNSEHECSDWHSRSRIDVHYVRCRRGKLSLLCQVLTFKVWCDASYAPHISLLSTSCYVP